MATTYWIEDSLAGIIPTLWMFLGLGLPWAFATISRRYWRSRALIGAVALALGPAWMTAWILILGVAGAQLEARLLKPEWILLGSVVIAGAGCLIALSKRDKAAASASPARPFAFDEKLIIALIGIAIIVRWVHTAFWPFTAYDALWVFGYQGRLFFLEGNIPNAIDYYPPFLSLQFAYVQTLIGEVNDHAARMVLPLLHIGSVLAVYLLGERLARRRVGLIAAALWSLHPYLGRWAQIADLEIPLTFGFTMASVFFLRAWRNEQNPDERRRDALLAGVMLGIALFTKPTAGAFIWGVLLLLAADLALKRFQIRRWRPRLGVAMWTGLACLPLGGAWYLRNLALGHDVITLPKAVWLTRALRSGDYLAPLALAAVLVWMALAIQLKLNWRRRILGAAGILLLLAGTLASNPLLFPERVNPPASAIGPAEAALIAAGLAVSVFSLCGRSRAAAEAPVKHMFQAGGWAMLLALPYFVTFFVSYSYHYRLGFASLPLLCLPSAIALSTLLDERRIQGWRRLTRRGYFLALCCLSLPGIAAPAFDVNWTSLWLADETLDSDIKKYQVFNPSLLEVVFGLEDYIRDAGEAPIVLAPGEERLPFFYPQMRIIDQPVSRLAEYEALAATHFIYGAKAREAYWDAGLDPRQTQMVASLGRIDLFKHVRAHYDGHISYEMYASHEIGSQRVLPDKYATGSLNQRAVVFDGQIRLRVHGAYPPSIFENTPITLEMMWQALAPLDRRLDFVLRFARADTKQVAQEWRLQAAVHRHGEYSTTHWETDEYIFDRHILRLDDDKPMRRRGQLYVFSIGLWDPLEQRFLPVTIDGDAAGEFYQLPGQHQLRT